MERRISTEQIDVFSGEIAALIREKFETEAAEVRVLQLTLMLERIIANVLVEEPLHAHGDDAVISAICERSFKRLEGLRHRRGRA
jgi:hypothetical protein